VCAEEEGAQPGPLAKYSGAIPSEIVCFGGVDPRNGNRVTKCGLCATKPGSQPAHLASAISDIIELNDLPENVTFAYPDALNIWQWAGLRALHRARNSDQKRGQAQTEPRQSGTRTSGNALAIGDRFTVTAN
jgi:hypothetical protein